MKNSNFLRTHAIQSIFLLSTTWAFSGCGSSNTPSTKFPNADGSGSEVAAASISGSAQSSEGSVAFLDGSPQNKSFIAKIEDLFIPNAFAATCAATFTSFTCTSGVLPIVLGSCTAGLASWTGNLFLTWTTGTCVSNPLSSGAASVYVRTTDATGLVRTVGTSTITITTSASGFSTSKSGGETISCGSSGCTSGRSIVINGKRYVGNSAGLAKWDHTVSTDASDPLVITGSGASRAIASGTIVTQHNIAKITSTSKITTPLTHNATCCFPVAGTLTTTYAGGSFDGATETLNFSSTCGATTLTKTDGSAIALQLTHCL